MSAHDCDNLGVHCSAFGDQPADGHRQFEASRSGAAGIEIENAISCLLLRHMAVAGDHNPESGRRGFEIKLRKVVQHVNADAAEFDCLGLWNSFCPCFAVDIAADRGQRGNRCEFIENMRISDIPGVNDVLGTAQGLHSLGTKKAVRVGDDANQDGSFSLLGYGPNS